MDDNILVALLARETEGVRTIAVADWLERGEGGGGMDDNIAEIAGDR